MLTYMKSRGKGENIGQVFKTPKPIIWILHGMTSWQTSTQTPQIKKVKLDKYGGF